MRETIFNEAPTTIRWIDPHAAPAKLTHDQIADIVCSYFKVKHKSVFARTRKIEIVNARQIIMFFIKAKTGMSLVNIGKLFSFDHSTVIHSIAKVKDVASTDDSYHADLMRINDKLGGEEINIQTVESKYSDKIKVKIKPFERIQLAMPKLYPKPEAVYSNSSPYKIAR